MNTRQLCAEFGTDFLSYTIEVTQRISAAKSS